MEACQEVVGAGWIPNKLQISFGITEGRRFSSTSLIIYEYFAGSGKRALIGLFNADFVRNNLKSLLQGRRRQIAKTVIGSAKENEN